MTYTLDLTGIEPHPVQGFHVKLTVNAEGSQGADVKHKVFWVTGCGPGATTTTSGTTTSTTGATTTSGATSTSGATTSSGATTTTVAVGGSSSSASGGSSAGGGVLPFTGGPGLPMLLAAGTLVGLGAVSVLVGSRRRRPTAGM